MSIERTRTRALILAASLLAVTALHRAAPAGPHEWHWVHVVAQRLYFIPLLLAAAWFSWRGSIPAALAASLLYLLHIADDWRGHPMVQTEQAASIASFWFIPLFASWFFERIRAALDEARAAHQDTLTALASSLELRERYTAGHSERVRAYTLLLAERMGVRDPETLAQWAAGALFHDIGKIGIEDAVLLKQGPLDPDERRAMRAHPDLGAALVGRIRSLAAIRELVLCHHERFDGAGYPKGLRGGEIPLGARLFAVADSFDAMTTDRPYRGGKTFDEAAGEIRAGRGTQYDPRVVDAFLSMPFATWSETASRHRVTLGRGTSPG